MTQDMETSSREILTEALSRRDWRNGKRYEFKKETSYDRWAWEFLSRNKVFIAEWTPDININFVRGLADKAGMELDAQVKLLKLGVFNRDLAVNSINTVQYLMSLDIRDSLKIFLADHLSSVHEKWGIEYFHSIEYVETHKEIDSPCVFKRNDPHLAKKTYYFINDSDKTEYYIEPVREHEFIYRINTNWPIESQVNAIKRHAMSEQNLRKEKEGAKPVTQVRLHIKKFPLYLRVFDGFESGASAREIADTISNGIDEKGVYNADRAARRLIDGDYRFIVQSAPHFQK
ncbi:hypothetical protein SAMN05216412_11268 [Nitrosospira multiformis]|uniref:Transcriptional regulator-like domain-containing protein n=2 Tax=Nitrosospira multiformis TaxID=1231 RepID=A0A1I0GBM5_9PROT|nr:hypothetical protein SAMN05216412_11268 [Nitrosospira multiformis]